MPTNGHIFAACVAVGPDDRPADALGRVGPLVQLGSSLENAIKSAEHYENLWREFAEAHR